MKKFIETQRNPTFISNIQEAMKRDGPNVMKSLEENGFFFSEEEKLVLAADLIVAGTDTISITLLWNFAIMCNYPEVQKKVSAEIDEFVKLNGRLPEFSERTESMHTQPELYPNPHEFIPERFMSNLKTMQSAANGRFEERDHFNFGFG
ncbi:hypothetical protein ABG067_008192, partial [Albugo candida]